MQTRGGKRVGVTDRVASTYAHEIAAGEDVGCELSNDVLDFIEDAADEKQDCRTQVEAGRCWRGRIKKSGDLSNLHFADRILMSFGVSQQCVCVRRFEEKAEKHGLQRRRHQVWKVYPLQLAATDQSNVPAAASARKVV